MTYRPHTIFELHIFKDVDNTSWTKPQIHTIPLSGDSVQPFLRYNGEKDGIVNLRRCSSAQLAFLTNHLNSKNVEVKKERDAAKAKRRAKEASDLKYLEFQIDAEMRRRGASSKLEENQDKCKVVESDNNKEHVYHSHADDGDNPTPLPSVNSTYNIREKRCTRNEFQNNRHSWSPAPPNFQYVTYPAPPPPPPFSPPHAIEDPLLHFDFDSRLPRPPAKISPGEQGSDWTLEAVDIDLVPFVTKLKLIPTSPQYYRGANADKKKFPVLSYKLAESAKTEFAVVYSRTIMRCSAKDDRNVRARRQIPYVASVYGAGSDGIGGDYDSEEEGIAETGGELENEDEDHDLEIVASQYKEVEDEKDRGEDII